MKFKKLSLLLLGGILLTGCSKASAIELSVVPNQSMVTGKAIVIDVKTEPVISIDPNSIEISGGESWVENGVIKFKASEPGKYTMKVIQDNVTSNTITIPLDTSNAIAKNETQSTSKSSQSTTSKSSTQNSTKNTPSNNQINTNLGGNQGQTNTPQTPTQNIRPTSPSVPTSPTTPTTPSTPIVDPEPSVPSVSTPSEDPIITPEETPTVEEETPNVEETPVVQPTPAGTPEESTPSAEDDPASTVQDTSMSVDQVYQDQSELIANKTPITVDGILPEALVSDGSGKEEQVLWNEELKEYIVLEGFTIPFGGCNAQVSGTLSRNEQGQLVLTMTYISTDDVPKMGGTGYHDVTSSQSATDTAKANASPIDRNNPTPHPEPGTNS